MESFLKHVNDIERRIGVRHDFFNELIREDDWGFVIKLHAFIESCLTHAICASLLRPELESIISRLETSNQQWGKLAFVKQLGLLNKPMRKFIVHLSRLRNDLVHDAKSVDFRFEQYMSDLNEDQRFEFCAALSLHEMFENEYEPGEISLFAWVNVAPKFGIAYASSLVISELLLRSQQGDLDKDLLTIGSRFFEQLTGSPLPNERPAN